MGLPFRSGLYNILLPPDFTMTPGNSGKMQSSPPVCQRVCAVLVFEFCQKLMLSGSGILAHLPGQKQILSPGNLPDGSAPFVVYTFLPAVFHILKNSLPQSSFTGGFSDIQQVFIPATGILLFQHFYIIASRTGVSRCSKKGNLHTLRSHHKVNPRLMGDIFAVGFVQIFKANRFHMHIQPFYRQSRVMYFLHS